MKRYFDRLPEEFRRYWGLFEWVARDRYKHYRARLHRSRLNEVTFVAITGSAGKTTTKDLAAAVLAKGGLTHKSHGTANQHSYLDDTVLGATSHHRFSVLEVSADRPGYLDRSLRLIRPRISVLTLIAREHYSAFRSLEAIAQEKGKLVSVLPPDGVAVLNIDDPQVRSVGERHAGTIVWVGRDEAATIRLIECSSKWPEPLTLRLMYRGQLFDIRTQMYGTHLAMSVALALGVGIAAGIPFEDAIAAVSVVEPVEGRMQVETTKDGIVFLRDDWKAPQWSLQSPFQFMKDADATRKIIVLGSISDSSKSPSQRYAHAAREALQAAHLVVLAGASSAGAEKVRDVGSQQSLQAFASMKDAAGFLERELRPGDLVLLKGTTKQDHLVRLVMNRRRPVHCWRSDCGIPRFCASCEHVYGPSIEPDVSIDTSSGCLPPLSFSGSPVVIGLGNQGAKYRNTPHNVGHGVVEFIAPSSADKWVRQAEGWTRTLPLDEGALTLFKPSAPMNSCGPKVSSFLARTGRKPADCIVIHDDMDLPLGDLRVKTSGGDGGHKGVRSLMVTLGTNNFIRVKIGVRRPGDLRSASDLVLRPFSRSDEPALRATFKRAESEILSLTRKVSNERAAPGEAPTS